MLRKVAICALTASALLVAGCGGSGDSTSEADDQAIHELVAKLNTATKDKNASEFCLLVQPSAIEKTFHDIDRCVSETKKILKTAGDQPVLKVDSITVDGDLASVYFEGDAGNSAMFVKEGGQWYVPLSQSDITTDSTGTTDGSEG